MSRIGVFICHWGTNIASVVDVKAVVEAVKKFPDVAFATDLQYSCSDLGQGAIREAIKTHHLDRVVVSSCTPRMHEITFQKCIEAGGLNRYLFEMANIREQVSWVTKDKEEATQKAILLTEMAIGKAATLQPLIPLKSSVEKRVLVIGGGISGIQAAIDVSLAGYKVTLVERLPSIGGRMAQLEKTFPTLDCSAWILTPRMTESSQDENIEILTYSEIVDVKGFVGNFDVTIRKKPRYVDIAKCTGCGLCTEKCPTKAPNEWDLGLGMRKAIYRPFSQAVPNVPVIDKENCTFFLKGKCKICQKLCPAGAVDYEQAEELMNKKFGAIIVATGFTQFDPGVYGEYGGGRFKDVITGLHLERMLDSSGPTGGHVVRPSDHKEPKNIVFIQCVGSRDESKGHPYCSRICCMYTAKQAILMKDHYPETQSYIFYIDIRAGGKNYEEFVKRAQREYGAIYIRGRVSKIYEKGDKLIVRGVDTLAGKQVEVEADLVVLATAVVPQPDAVGLAKILNIPHDQYGFYSEAHPKLQPVESVTKGIFLTGSCQFPKDIPDSVATTGAASVRACEILSKDELILDPKIAFVNPEICSGCLNCVEVCPFDAIETREVDGKVVAQVVSTLCHGCGNCAATCRTKAANVQGFSDDQIYAQVASVFEVLRKEKFLELSE